MKRKPPRIHEPPGRQLALQALEHWYAHEVYLGRAHYAQEPKAVPDGNVPADSLRGPDVLQDRRRANPDWYKSTEVTAHGVASRNSLSARQPFGEGMTVEVKQRQEEAEERLNGRVREAMKTLEQQCASYHACVLMHLSGRSLAYMANQLAVQKPRAAEMLECGVTWVLCRLTMQG